MKLMIKQRVFSFGEKFEIILGGAIRGYITKQFTLFWQKYDVDFNGWHGEIPISSTSKTQQMKLWTYARTCH